MAALVTLNKPKMGLPVIEAVWENKITFSEKGTVYDENWYGACMEYFYDLSYFFWK